MAGQIQQPVDLSNAHDLIQILEDLGPCLPVPIPLLVIRKTCMGEP
jgi:hypothetical protein